MHMAFRVKIIENLSLSTPPLSPSLRLYHALLSHNSTALNYNT